MVAAAAAAGSPWSVAGPNVRCRTATECSVPSGRLSGGIASSIKERCSFNLHQRSFERNWPFDPGQTGSARGLQESNNHIISYISFKKTRWAEANPPRTAHFGGPYEFPCVAERSAASPAFHLPFPSRICRRREGKRPYS